MVMAELERTLTSCGYKRHDYVPTEYTVTPCDAHDKAWKDCNKKHCKKDVDDHGPDHCEPFNADGSYFCDFHWGEVKKCAGIPE